MSPVARSRRRPERSSSSVPITLLVLGLASSLGALGLHPDVLRAHATLPVDAVTWSIPPLLVYASFRRYLQGMGVVRPVMIALVDANVLNVFVNWVLIFGHLGAPAHGRARLGVGDRLSRVVMCAFLLVVDSATASTAAGRDSSRRRSGSRGAHAPAHRAGIARGQPGDPRSRRVRRRDRACGTPSAGSARGAPDRDERRVVHLHGAARRRVGRGGAGRPGGRRRDAAGAARSGWTALLFGTLFMAAPPRCSCSFPRVLIGAFTTDASVLQVGTSLLFVAAVFQLFDGLQGVATGVLRGLGDTRTPMLWNLAAHWFARPSARLHVVLHCRAWRDRVVVGALVGPDHLRRRARGGMVATGTPTGGVSPA